MKPWIPKIQSFAEQYGQVIIGPKLSQKLQGFKEKYPKIKPIILSDYDHTFTTFSHKNHPCPAAMGVLRHSNLFSLDFSNTLSDLYNKYHPIEKRVDISNEEKKEIISEWNNQIREIYIKENIKMHQVDEALNKVYISFRYYVEQYIQMANQHNIPIYIISGGISQIIQKMLNSLLQNKLGQYSNINIISNDFVTLDDQVIDFQLNVIGSIKHTYIRQFGIDYENQPVFTIGDLNQDISMAKDFNPDNTISILFLREDMKDDIEEYLENWDVIIQGDGSFLTPYLLLQNIIQNGNLRKGYLSHFYPYSVMSKRLVFSPKNDSIKQFLGNQTQLQQLLAPSSI